LGSIHLIGFADRETRARVIGTFHEVRATRIRFPGNVNVMGVTIDAQAFELPK
jgi:hypothetical protein